jgi:hypothetical protein
MWWGLPVVVPDKSSAAASGWPFVSGEGRELDLSSLGF